MNQTNKLNRSQTISFINNNPKSPKSFKIQNKLHLRLKNQLSLKFNKHQRNDQRNKSITITEKHSFKKHNSLIFNNPLTKTNFSLCDSVTHKATIKHVQPIQKIKKPLTSRQVIDRSFKYSLNKSYDDNTFQTKISDTLIPINNNKILPKSQSASIFQQNKQQKHMKFKLLFRDKHSKVRSVVEKTIAKIDNKIQQLKQKKILFKSMMPKSKVKQIVQKIVPRGQIVKKQKIMSLALSLIKNIQLYFNMFQHPNLVAGHYKKIDVFNDKVKKYLMKDNQRAKRILNVEEITDNFWSYKPTELRPQFFGQEDLLLYNTLNNFMVKMQKKYQQNLIRYKFFQCKKRKQQKQAYKKQIKTYQNKFGKHQQINKINKFIQTRTRFNQDRRQSNMKSLQQNGVKLNLIERSRQLILRQKQKAFKMTLTQFGPSYK